VTKKRLLAISSVVLVALVSAVLMAGPLLSSLLHKRIETFLESKFQSAIEIDNFRFSIAPVPSVTIVGLTLRHHNRTDVPPLIQIQSLSMAPHLTTVFRPVLRFGNVRLEGLKITLPPRDSNSKPAGAPPARKPVRFPIFVEMLEANDAAVTILRAQPEKDPLEYPIHSLKMKDLSFDGPAAFEAWLTNAVPRGEIHVRGTFGPWNGELPRATPIQANYQFQKADLSTIKGLQGVLSSTGSFGGPLDYMEVTGTTETPDFTLRRVGNPIELKTTFTAAVDGTNGNTYLHSIEAQFLSTTLHTSGQIVDLVSGVRSRTILIDATSDSARAEDLIRLAAKTDSPVLRGPVKLTAKIEIPEGDRDLSDRLKITSNFHLLDGLFTNPEIQQKVDALSRKGQGEPKDLNISHVRSQLDASLRVTDGVVGFDSIRFTVPGARLDLHGSYTLGNGGLDFRGDLYLDAKLSQTTTGWKALLLKAVDPFFRGEDGGSRLPVKIEGTKDRPVFGLDRAKPREQVSEQSREKMR